MSEFSVPDAIEPVVGWRYWRLDERTGRLRSLTCNRLEWAPGRPASASCRAAHDPTDPRLKFVGGLRPEPHRSPDEGCTCGIYAARDLPRLRGQLLAGLGSTVVGEVSLWGKVIPGQHGFRAERAYPKRLFVMRRAAERIAGALEALGRYRVPVEVIDDGRVAFDPGAALRLAAVSIGAALTRLVVPGRVGLDKERPAG